MKKSRAVRISLVSSLAGAALSAGCGTAGALRKPPGWQACVDRTQDIVVEARYCTEEMNQSATLDLARPYAWYYYPWNDSEGPAIGGPVPPGGSYSMRPLASVPTAGSGVVVRGGLGSTAGGHVSTGG
jgi:hypothetical protein